MQIAFNSIFGPEQSKISKCPGTFLLKNVSLFIQIQHKHVKPIIALLSITFPFSMSSCMPHQLKWKSWCHSVFFLLLTCHLKCPSPAASLLKAIFHLNSLFPSLELPSLWPLPLMPRWAQQTSLLPHFFNFFPVLILPKFILINLFGCCLVVVYVGAFNFLFWQCHTACGVLVPWPVIKHTPFQ